MTRSTVQKAKDTGLDYFLFTESEQEGSSFGERFINSITRVFDLGYDTIITIGNDSPQLSTSHINEAYIRLQKGQLTIGPSYDGGFYLLAISKEQFCKNTFKTFAWQTNKVFEQVYAHITTTSSTTDEIHLLPVLYDLDSVSCVKRILAQITASQKNLVKWLQKLLSELNHFYTEGKDICTSYFREQFYNKGSPSLPATRT